MLNMSINYNIFLKLSFLLYFYLLKYFLLMFEERIIKEYIKKK